MKILEIKKVLNLLVTFTLFCSFANAESQSNLNKQGVMLAGYDAVSYFNGAKPLKGDAKFSVKQGDATYLFANEGNKQAFLKEPRKYEPQYGGWCAYAVADSKSKVDVDPESFLVQDGRLLLFYKGFWGDTRDKWQHTKDKTASAYLKQADENWPATRDTKP